MKTGDHVRYGKGKKVHLVAEATDVFFARLHCQRDFKEAIIYTFHPTSSPVTCKKCLKKEAK